jgi:hypothetical protein
MSEPNFLGIPAAMNENPYESATVDGPRKTLRTKWAIWSGVTCLLLAALCAVAAVAGMIASFRTVAAASSTPRAKDLAEEISNSLIPAFAIVPLGLAGIVLLITGFVVRRPASSE